MTKFIPSQKSHVAAPPVQHEGPKPSVGVDPVLLDLVRLRMAQIRESALSVEKHWLDLQARGESAERLDQVHLWRESSFFNDKEKAALALGEAILLDPTKPILNQNLEEVRHLFKPEELVALLLALMAVNDQSHSTTQDATGETLPPVSTKTARLAQTHNLPHYWRKLAHQLADRASIKV
jgi:hypothetical protein